MSLSDILGEGRAWMVDALCTQVSMDEFYPDKGPSGVEQIHFAKKVCGLCHVREACLDYALRHGERQGIWGGLSPRSREAVRRKKNLPPLKPAVWDDWHGMPSGARRHNREGTPVCERCRKASARAAVERRRDAS